MLKALATDAEEVDRLLDVAMLGAFQAPDRISAKHRRRTTTRLSGWMIFDGLVARVILDRLALRALHLVLRRCSIVLVDPTRGNQ